MNDTVLVQFTYNTREEETIEIRLIDAGFRRLGFLEDRGGFKYVWGTMRAEDVVALKLKDTFLADKMLTSYISKEEKDKYRK